MTLVVHDMIRTALPMVGVGSVVETLSQSYQALYGALPPATMLAGVAALVGVENAGGVAIYDGNMGNLSAIDGDVYANPNAQPGAPSYFIAFGGPGAGAGALWLYLAKHSRSALLAALRGDPGQMARELYRTGYVSAVPGVDEGKEIASYAKGAWAYYRKVWGYAWTQSSDQAHASPLRAVAGLSAGVLALGAMGAVARKHAA
jgi:hypothetical protein